MTTEFINGEEPKENLNKLDTSSDSIVPVRVRMCPTVMCRQQVGAREKRVMDGFIDGEYKTNQAPLSLVGYDNYYYDGD